MLSNNMVKLPIHCWWNNTSRLRKDLIDLNEHCPLYLIDAPSGMGKTQMGITLTTAMAGRVTYLVRKIIGGRIQPIYECFRAKSDLFDEVVNHDSQGVDGLSTFDLAVYSKQLTLVAFLAADMGLELNNFTIPELRAAIKNPVNSGKLKVFVVDEVLPVPESTNTDKNAILQIRYFRNVFRSVGLPEVLMGTNSTASNADTIVVNKGNL